MFAKEQPAGVVLYDPGLAGGAGPELIWRPVAGHLLLAWSVHAAVTAPGIAGLVLVVPPARVAAVAEIAAAQDWQRLVVLPAQGVGLAPALSQAMATLPASCRWVVAHDLARPLVMPELLLASLAAARRTGAASASEPVKETIKRVAQGRVVETLERSRLRLLQTPQAFERARLAEACARFPAGAPAPDAATIALAAGLAVATFPGDPDNLAVRSEDDLRLAERLLLQRGGPPA